MGTFLSTVTKPYVISRDDEVGRFIRRGLLSAMTVLIDRGELIHIAFFVVGNSDTQLGVLWAILSPNSHPSRLNPRSWPMHIAS